MKKQTDSEYDAALRDPEFWLDLCESAYANSQNPYYVWRAIGFCIHKKEFPDWVIAYLEQCVGRILSPKTKKSRDFRKDLPWVFDFTSERGPGNPLDPDRGEPDLQFGAAFALRLWDGEQPIEAMRNACNDVFDAGADDFDDKKLKRWLFKLFNLKKWPATVEELIAVTRDHIGDIADAVERSTARTKSRETLG